MRDIKISSFKKNILRSSTIHYIKYNINNMNNNMNIYMRKEYNLHSVNIETNYSIVHILGNS